jgi:hypothetical protein
MRKLFILSAVLFPIALTCVTVPVPRSLRTPPAPPPAPPEPETPQVLTRVVDEATQDDASPAKRSEPPEPSRGALVLTALKEAYPQRVDAVERRDDDWAIQVGEQWFYWAQGRLLPSELRDRWENYHAIPFYNYSRELRPIRPLTEEENAALQERLRHRDENPPTRHPGFYNAVWRIHDRDSSWARVKTTYFLGIKTTIHRELLEDLAGVEEDILEAARHDPELAAFVDSIAALEGYNWRRIADTASLSYHSYGAAIDIIPRSYDGKQAYWLWARRYYPEWYALPYEKRWMPPTAFVEAFERHGFVWGGKWFRFDAIHFEYRPEILILSGAFPKSSDHGATASDRTSTQ